MKFEIGEEVYVFDDDTNQQKLGTVVGYVTDGGDRWYRIQSGGREELYKESLIDCVNEFKFKFPPNLQSAIDDIYGTDQDAKKDAGKPRLTLVPRKIIWDIAAVRMFAVSKKYKDPDNWKKVSPQRFKDAAMRHFLKYLDDPKSLDEESGLNHLWHMACNVAFLCELEDKDES